MKETKKIKVPSRKKGEHLWVPAGGFPICATCGCDEDDAFVGGQECTYTPPRKKRKSHAKN